MKFTTTIIEAKGIVALTIKKDTFLLMRENIIYYFHYICISFLQIITIKIYAKAPTFTITL